MNRLEEIQQARGLYADFHLMQLFGPQNVDQLIAEMLIRRHTFFMYTGAKDFQQIYDLIDKDIEIIGQNIYLFMFPKADNTLRDFLMERPWKHADDLICTIATLAYDGNIPNVLPKSLYEQICSLTDDETVVQWGKTRRNPIVENYIAATSNCCILSEKTQET